MAFTISPNMALVIPGVGTEAGPTYATDVNNSLTIIDAHTHVAGSGVLITPAAISINVDLPMNNNSLTGVKSVVLTPQLSTTANNSLYDFGGNLHFVDGTGIDIAITAGGVVNATSSGISSGTATASFVGGVLVVNAAPLTPANIQAASYLMGNNTAGTNFLTLQPPNAMAANYSLTFPTLPSQTNVMTLDTSGNMGSITYDAVGQNMTVVGADAIAANIDTTGANAIGSNMTNLSSGISSGGKTVVVSNTTFGPIGLIGGFCNGTASGSGTGFTWTSPGTGVYNINFNSAFTGVPGVVATSSNTIVSDDLVASIGTVTSSSVVIVLVLAFNDVRTSGAFHFIAMGQRS